MGAEGGKAENGELGEGWMERPGWRRSGKAAQGSDF